MHLFISHSTEDAASEAHELAAALEAAGYRCWIAPRDVKAGVPYPGQIVAAIENSAGLVLLVTPAANESPDVLQEAQLASSARKIIAPVMLRATQPAPDLRYYVGVRHQLVWSDAAAIAAALSATFGATLCDEKEDLFLNAVSWAYRSAKSHKAQASTEDLLEAIVEDETLKAAQRDLIVAKQASKMPIIHIALPSEHWATELVIAVLEDPVMADELGIDMSQFSVEFVGGEAVQLWPENEPEG